MMNLRSSVKVGDLVELDFHVTRKGRPEDDRIGLVVEIKENGNGNPAAIIDFCGILCEYPVRYLRVINESG